MSARANAASVSRRAADVAIPAGTVGDPWYATGCPTVQLLGLCGWPAHPSARSPRRRDRACSAAWALASHRDVYGRFVLALRGEWCRPLRTSATAPDFSLRSGAGVGYQRRGLPRCDVSGVPPFPWRDDSCSRYAVATELVAPLLVVVSGLERRSRRVRLGGLPRQNWSNGRASVRSVARSRSAVGPSTFAR